MKTVSFAIATAIVIAGSAAAQACQHACGHSRVMHPAPLVAHHPIPLPPHYVVEHGPLYDGLGVHAAPRLYAPRVASHTHSYIYGYGVGFSGGPVALSGYRYVTRMRHHRAPLRVSY